MTDEERETRDGVRAYCEKEDIPVIGEYRDRAEFPFKDGPAGEIRPNEPGVLNAQGRQWPQGMRAASEEVGEDPENPWSS